MAPERTRQLVLGGLVVVLIAVFAKVWTDTSTASSASSNTTGGANAPRQQQARGGAPAPPGVRLEALKREKPEPEATERNLFRFKPKAPPPAPPAPPRPVQPVTPAAPTGPPPPPAIAPITLKFIGVMEAPAHGQKIAILSDGRNAPFYGKEGAIIEGRWRILKIGVESVELAYADGRGRQTIRLTGS